LYEYNRKIKMKPDWYRHTESVRKTL